MANYLLLSALAFLILIYLSMSSRGSPATQAPQAPKHPPARSGAATTRRLTLSYASLTTGHTKEDMLSSLAFSSSINTPESARKYLVDHFLITTTQDPDHPSLSQALLHLTFTASGITAPTADTIRAVAILIDTLTPSLVSSELINPQQNSSPESLKNQLSLLGTYIEAL